MYQLISRYLYFAAQKLRRENVLGYLTELEESQWYSPQKVRELQWERLKKILTHAYENVPYYRSKFDNCGIKPEDITSYEKFSGIPFLTKVEVRNNFKDFLARDCKRSVEYSSTSGTTGELLKYVRDRASMGYTRAAQYRGRRWLGADIGTKEMLMFTTAVDPVKLAKEKIKDLIKNRMRLSAFDMSEKSMRRFFDRCRRFQPKFLYGVPSQIYRLAQFINEKNLDVQGLGLKLIITTTEVLYEHHRRMIESTFKCPIFKEYGASEVGILAFECPQGNMHITSENVYLEFVDDKGNPVSSGSGEIIVTELHNYAMPFIRYKIGDVGYPSGKICGCGRGLPCIDRVEGRMLEMVLLKNGKSVHGRIFDYINRELLDEKKEIREYQVVQESEDELLVKVVKEPHFGEETLNYWKKRIHELLGPEVRITYEFVKGIPPEKSGKRRYFVSKIRHR
ncbi:MAG: phenylacetate--CoA ligase family protein [Elusimicrobia bacterium]|nr:phenylacetate--CoA ligase family protein [Elusimicrobiota bacterium]